MRYLNKYEAASIIRDRIRGFTPERLIDDARRDMAPPSCGVDEAGQPVWSELVVRRWLIHALRLGTVLEHGALIRPVRDMYGRKVAALEVAKRRVVARKAATRAVQYENARAKHYYEQHKRRKAARSTNPGIESRVDSVWSRIDGWYW